MVAGEADVFLYMDELCILFQVLEGILRIVSTISVDFDYSVFFSSREYIRKFISVRKDAINHQMSVGAEDKTLFRQSTQFTTDAHLEFGRVDVILDKSRKKGFTMMKTGSASSSVAYHDQLLLNLPDIGMGICLPPLCIQISCEERHMKLLVDLLEFRSIIFKSQDEMDIFSNDFMIRDIHPSRQLYECFLTSFVLHLSVGYDSNFMSFTDGSAGTGSSSAKPVEKGGVFFPVASKVSVVRSHGSHQGFPSTSLPVPGFCFLAELEVGEIIVADCSMRNLLTGQHSPCRLELLTSSGGGFHTINFDSQGGSFFLETSTLTMFIQSIKAYFLCISCLHLWVSSSSSKQCEKAGALAALNEHVAGPSSLHQRDTKTTVRPKFSSETWKLFYLKSLDVIICQFSITLAVADDPDMVQCLTLEADINLRLTSLERSLSFNILNCTVFSQLLHKNSLSMVEIDNVHSRSRISNGLETCVRCCPRKGIPLGLDNAQSSKAVSEREISLDIDESGSSSLHHPHYILKHLYASIMLKKTTLGSEPTATALQLKSDWMGNGSISGFDLIISLSEIQMLLALFSPLMKMLSTKSGKLLKGSFGSQTQGQTNDPCFTIPDGAIVAIQDLHQHLYLAVEGVGVKYHVVGVLHYSLVGERALFRVKWHKQKPTLFSLSSLDAKDDTGEPLRLNFRPGSGFVEISSNDERGHALWKILPCKADNYGDDDDMEFYSYCTSGKKSFHLVNHKNNSGVAFVDGTPEFVQKPGSPFKLKVFHNLTQAYDAGMHDAPYCSPASSVESNVQGDVPRAEENSSLEGGNLVHMDIMIDRIVFTICHEVSDADDKFPLLRGCIGDVHIIGQILPSKFRFMCTHFIAIDYFNVRRNIWRKIISPVDACIFLHSRFTVKALENVQKGIPTHYYFRIKQVDVSLTELSLDILLFIAGKLNVAGPYALRNSIFCNCCKAKIIEGFLHDKTSTSFTSAIDEACFSTDKGEKRCILWPFFFFWKVDSTTSL
ncbi:hypothetical protein Taro_013089 [Colocasia esculenta]|uniref:Uncharacterized protein n=1 Tax=Colocasia esculenta TaxID=4460 RepID=A0A843U5N2_COLES|nr:hypothetical protein [Colocasia esculenta]